MTSTNGPIFLYFVPAHPTLNTETIKNTTINGRSTRSVSTKPNPSDESRPA
jgi:hypothetical protein